MNLQAGNNNIICLFQGFPEKQRAVGATKDKERRRTRKPLSEP